MFLLKNIAEKWKESATQRRTYLKRCICIGLDLRLWIHSTRILSHTRGHDCLMLELWNSYWRLNLGPSAWVQSETYNTIVARVEFLNSVVSSITALEHDGGFEVFITLTSRTPVQRFYYFITFIIFFPLFLLCCFVLFYYTS